MPNRVLPENLRFEPALLACSKGARLFFLHLWMCVDDYRRAPVGPSPSNPTVLRSMCHPAETDIRIPDVARWLNELSLAGAVAIHDSDRGWYVEIADRLWYRREDYQEGQPKYGPRKPKVPEQQNLPMPGMINLVERPNVPSRKVPIQTQSESNPKSETIPNQRAKPARKDSGTRARCAGGDSADSDEAKRDRGDFARSEEAFPTDEAWADVVRELGEREMWDCGSLWADRWTLASAQMAAAYRDWRTLPPTERASGSFAKYLTAAFMRVLKGAA
jgi:hypothetical protein